MKVWKPFFDPDLPRVRERSTVKGGPAEDKFGQRPLFSDATVTQEPKTGRLPPEARLDDLVPSDRREGSNSRESE